MVFLSLRAGGKSLAKWEWSSIFFSNFKPCFRFLMNSYDNLKNASICLKRSKKHWKHDLQLRTTFPILTFKLSILQQLRIDLNLHMFLWNALFTQWSINYIRNLINILENLHFHSIDIAISIGVWVRKKNPVLIRWKQQQTLFVINY